MAEDDFEGRKFTYESNEGITFSGKKNAKSVADWAKLLEKGDSGS